MNDLVAGLEARIAELEAQVERLERWKTEALHVDDKWCKVADAVESVAPGPLGGYRADNALRFVNAAIRRHG